MAIPCKGFTPDPRKKLFCNTCGRTEFEHGPKPGAEKPKTPAERDNQLCANCDSQHSYRDHETNTCLVAGCPCRGFKPADSAAPTETVTAVSDDVAQAYAGIMGIFCDVNGPGGC
jgi:hypothetical protein